MGFNKPGNYKKLSALKKSVGLSLEFIKKEAANCDIQNDHANKKKYFDNLAERLLLLQEEINTFDALLKGERQPRIGVFGNPGMGKSTLLNVILGVEMLPTSGSPGTTRFGTSIVKSKRNDKNFLPDMPYKIKRMLFNGPPETRDCAENYNDITTILEDFSKEADLKDPKTKEIIIEGPFDSFIDNDFIFIDTPGIEFGAAPENFINSIFSHNWEADKNRAMEVLNNVDIAIFCIKLTLPDFRNTIPLYNELVKDKNPVNVITASDARKKLKDPDKETNDGIKKYMLEKGFKLMMADTVVLSAKKALDIIKAAKNKRKINELVDKEFLGEDPEGFKELKTLILKKLGLKNKSFTANRIAGLEDKFNDIKIDIKTKFNILLPPKPAKMKRIRRFLKDVFGIIGALLKILGKILLVILAIALLAGIAFIIFNK